MQHYFSELAALGGTARGQRATTLRHGNPRRDAAPKAHNYSPRLSESFSTFWNKSDGLSPEREY